MAQWVPICDVEEIRACGRTASLGPALVWATNYAARNPFPRKFLYTACSYVGDSGMACKKSLEFGARCGQSSGGEPKFRFQVVLIDAMNARTSPLKAQIWDSASLLLNCSAIDFSLLDPMTQMTTVQKVFQNSPKLAVWFAVKGLEVTIQRFVSVDDSILVPSQVTANWPASPVALGTPTQVGKREATPSSTPVPLGTPSQRGKREATPSRPPSARKLITDLIEALNGTDLDEYSVRPWNRYFVVGHVVLQSITSLQWLCELMGLPNCNHYNNCLL